MSAFNESYILSIVQSSLNINHTKHKNFLQINMNLKTKQLFWTVGIGDVKEVAFYNDKNIVLVGFVKTQLTKQRLISALDRFIYEIKYMGENNMKNFHLNF